MPTFHSGRATTKQVSQKLSPPQSQKYSPAHQPYSQTWKTFSIVVYIISTAHNSGETYIEVAFSTEARSSARVLGFFNALSFALKIA
jgi:hypothetical protein